MLVVFTAASLTFALLHLAPGDPYTNIDGGLRTSPEVRAMRRAQRGLDLPLARQYARWLASYARGSLGWSTSQQRSVRAVLAERLPRTLLLMLCALAASLSCGIAVGAWQGARARSPGDRATSLVSLILLSFPEFWLAIILMLVLTPWPFPVSGMVADDARYMGAAAQLRDRAWHLALPCLTLTLIGAAMIARYQRSAMREAFGQPFVQTARAKGLPDAAVRRHALRTALLPVASVAGVMFPSLLAGAVFVESVFAWPGMGSMMLSGLGARDYDLVSAGVVVVAALTVVGNLCADLLREAVDPRTRHA